MTSKKKLITLGALTYLLSIALFQIVNYISFIIIPKHKDWELFSFNFYGSILFFGLAMIPYALLILLINKKRIKYSIIVLIMLVSMEIVSLLIAGESIMISIFTTMIKDKNYILLAYPSLLVICYYISKKILKFDKSI
jgi:hypothetical protein